jgi:hypothetical protein
MAQQWRDLRPRLGGLRLMQFKNEDESIPAGTQA